MNSSCTSSSTSCVFFRKPSIVASRAGNRRSGKSIIFGGFSGQQRVRAPCSSLVTNPNAMSRPRPAPRWRRGRVQIALKRPSRRAILTPSDTPFCCAYATPHGFGGRMQVLINIDVDDLDRAIQFYRDAFGFEVTRRFGADGAELTGAGAPIYLLRKAQGSRPAGTVAGGRDYARHWTPVHLDFVVDDVDAAVGTAV